MRSLIAVSLLALAAGSLDAQARPGRLVIIGGGLNSSNEAVYRAVLGARLNNGPICIIPTAAAEPDSAINPGNWERHGGAGAATGVLVSWQRPETAHDPAVVAKIRTCGGFYFVGGVQSRVVTAFRPNGVNTPAYDALMQRFREGAVVAGSSAGAAIMTDPMIAGGSSAPALATGVRHSRAEADTTDDVGGVNITAGLGFLANAITDQHFLARGRIGRLIVAVADPAIADVGFGVDENTALVVDGDVATVAGASGVVVVDAARARTVANGYEDVTLHLMSTGDQYNLRTKAMTVGASKKALPAGAAPVAPANAFTSWTFLHFMQSFAATSGTSVSVPVEGGRMSLRKAADFAAAHSDTGGVRGSLRGLSVRGLRVDLVRDSTVRVRIDTDAGAITADLYPGRAPVTVANFLRYVDAGLYSDGAFHRAVRMDNQPNDTVRIEVIQGGMSSALRGQGFPPIALERTNVTGLRHVDGALSMARGAPDTATNNFFITIGAQPSLDFGGHRNLDGQGFAVFGRVTGGMDVVRRIQSGETQGQTLKTPVRILKVSRIG